MAALQRGRRGRGDVVADPFAPVLARASLRMAEGAGLRKPARNPEAPCHAAISSSAMLVAAVPLGTPVSVHTLRWFADQASERVDQHFLLWRSDRGNCCGDISVVEHSLKK